MATKIRLNNFRFSIYIDADGTVTLTDLPPELRDVAAALDPSREWASMCPAPGSTEAPPRHPPHTCSEQPPGDVTPNSNRG